MQTKMCAVLQVKQYRKLLLGACLRSLRVPVSTCVTAEGMEALTKILAELREGDVGSSFDTISEHCRLFFDDVSAHGRARLWLRQNGRGRVLGQRGRRLRWRL